MTIRSEYMNTLGNPNFLRKASLGLAAAIGFSACSGQANVDSSPKERFIHDYVFFYSGNGSVDCLYKSAYDLDSGKDGRASVTPPSSTFDSEAGILTITPASGENSLHLEGFDQVEHRVTPVGPDDQAIFDSYGCEPKGY